MAFYDQILAETQFPAILEHFWRVKSVTWQMQAHKMAVHQALYLVIKIKKKGCGLLEGDLLEAGGSL